MSVRKYSLSKWEPSAMNCSRRSSSIMRVTVSGNDASFGYSGACERRTRPVLRPFRASVPCVHAHPGLRPGLSSFGPLGLTKLADFMPTNYFTGSLRGNKDADGTRSVPATLSSPLPPARWSSSRSAPAATAGRGFRFRPRFWFGR